MRKIFGTMAIAAAMIATPAMANADNFDGARVGVLIGATGDDFAFDNPEFTYGGVVGYDVAINDGFLIGVEADVTGVEVDAGALSTLGLGAFDVDNRQISAAVRATVPVSERVALFSSVGYTNLNFDFDNGTISDSVDFDGYRIGGGAEFKVSDRVYASAEYRYNDFDFNGAGGSGVHTAVVGFGLRF